MLDTTAIAAAGRVRWRIAHRNELGVLSRTPSSATSPSHNGKDHCDGCWRLDSPLTKESSDVDDPHDHSVANPIVRLGRRAMMDAIVPPDSRTGLMWLWLAGATERS
jgi:hypothetical protein